MRRVLRLTAVLFGIGLIGMTGMLETTRHSHEADPVLLVAGSDGERPNTTALYLMGAASTVRQRISPPAYTYWDNSRVSAGKWLYMLVSQTEKQSNTYTGTPLRISRDGLRVEQVTDKNMNLEFVSTPEDKWLLSISEDEVGNVDIIRMQAQDAENPYNLTASFEPSVSYSPPEHLKVSEDGRWVYFEVYQQDHSIDVFRVSIDGGVPENLSNEIEETVHLIAATNDWLLFSTPQMAYITDADGDNSRALITDSMQISSIYVEWIAPLNLVIVGTYFQGDIWLWAFEMPGGTLQWRYEGLALMDVSPSDGAFVVKDEADSILYMSADGRQPPKVILSDGEYRWVRYKPNGELYFLRDAPTDMALWQMNLQDGTTEKIYEPITHDAGFWEWSKDGKWVAMLDYDLNTNSNAYHYTIANSLGRPAYRLNNQLKYATLFRWLPPIDRDWSPAGLLLMGSVLMLGGIMRRGGRRKT